MVGKETIYIRYIKGIIDRILACIGLICFWWLYLLIAIAIKLDDPKGPVIFKQERLGKKGKIYRMYKFRSMRVGAEHIGSGVYSNAGDPRITHVGRILRKTSLDELPQLINILKGDMALIGPRPLLVKYLPLYSQEQARRHEVRPGITGWAQCHGRNAISWTERFKLDVWYVDHCSIWTDIKVIFITIKKVLCRADISSATSATMEPFNGNN